MACLWTTPPAALLCLALLAAAAGGAAAVPLPLTEGGVCPEGYVVCMDGEGCVPTEALCDGTQDCKDHSDELPFRCAAHASESPAAAAGAAAALRDTEALEPPAGPGAVEAAVGEADGAAPTPTPCLDSEHRCLDGTCISKARMCDSTRDCHDGSDEDALAGCSQASGNSTLEEEGPRAEWLDEAGPEARNGVDHLPVDGAQPLPPSPRACNTPHEFACNDGTCIPRNLTCDQHSDCPDGSDETLACPTMLDSCHDDFECSDGLCVPRDWVCDGHPDCRDSSDEHPLICTNWKKRPLVDHTPDPMHSTHPNVARDSGDPCERMEPRERQRCWEDQLHKMKVEEVQLRQRVAREQLEAAQAEAAAAKQLRYEQLQTVQLQRLAAQELLQQQQELHTLRLQTLKHAVAAALSEPLAEATTSSDVHAAA